MRVVRRTALAAAAVVALLFVGAVSSAQATITASQITHPTSSRILDTDSANFEDALQVSGTTTGTGDVDLLCYTGPNPWDYDTLASGVTVTSNAFSTSVSEHQLPAAACTLRATPAGSPPAGSPSAFAGPQLTIDWQEFFRVIGGPNSGDLYDYYTWDQQGHAGADYLSISSCGLCDMRLLTDPANAINSRFLFFGNAAVYANEFQASNNRAYGQIDGHNVLFSREAHNQPTATDQSGFPTLGLSSAVDPTTQDLAIDESADAVRCPSDTLPYGSGAGQNNCPSFIATGVHLHRTIVQTADGVVVRIVDVWSSTDNAAHAVDLDYDQAFQNSTSGTTPPPYEPSFEFPWVSSAFATHSLGDTIPAAPANGGPTSIFIRGNSTAPDGDTYYPQGAIIADPPPQGSFFKQPQEFYLHYAFTVPAGGAVTIKQSFAMGTTSAAVAALAAQAADQQEPPVVSITAPANGSTVTSSPVNVTGTATDNGGVASLTVNGAPVTPGAGGAYSRPVALAPGANTITVTATDHAGNTTTATTNVRFQPALVVPVIPKPFSIMNAVARSDGKILETLFVPAPGKVSANARTSTALAARAHIARARCKAGFVRRGNRCVRKTTKVFGSATATARGAGTITLLISPSSAARKALAAGRTLRVTVTNIFTASAGATHTTTVATVTVKGHKPKAKHKKK